MKSVALFKLVIVIFFVMTVDPGAGQILARPAVEDSTDKETDKKKDRKALPLEPARTLKFSTDEATWMSVDVSPDGGTIVFDLLGDLYTMPISGGKASKLTHGMAYDTQPRYSPDGEHVVFISDSSGSDNVWMIELADKELKALTKSKDDSYLSPEWTPDGKYIVVSRGKGVRGTPKLWLLHMDGGSGAALIKEPENIKTIGAAFGKDDRYIWFAQRRGSWQYNAILPQYQLARYDRETGKSTVMTSRHGSAMRPALSPDGKYLVYGSRYDHQTGLRLRDLNTGEEDWLAYPVQRDDQEAIATSDVMPGFSFTPDSKSVIVSYGGKLWQIDVVSRTQKPIPFTVDVELEMGPEVRFDYEVDSAQMFTARQIRHPAPSPDGSKLVFTALDRLWIKDMPNGEPKRVTKLKVGEHFPAWSPDGKWIAFASWQDTAGGHIYKIRANGRGAATQLTTASAVYSDLVWSPDGNRVVAVRTSSRELQESVSFFFAGLDNQFIYISSAGGAATVIAPTEGRTQPHFTNSSDRIFAYGTAGLVSFRWDGTDLKTHVEVKGVEFRGNPMSANLVLMAPEGDKALALLNSHIYTITVPYVGGETPTVNIANPEGASFPVQKLTGIGGQFPVWSADAKKVHWAIGNAFLTYNLDDAKAFTDSLAKAARDTSLAAGDSTSSDSTSVAKSEDKDKKEKPKYEPLQQRIVIKARRDIPKGMLVLRGGRAITMRNHEIIENADIIIDGNRIQTIGRRGEVEIPPEAKVMDISGKTVIPGFVDTHAHLRPSIDIHITQPWAYLANLAYGVTTTRDPQTSTTDVLSYSDLVETGDMIGPRIYSTGPGVFGFEKIKDQEHARSILQRYSEYYDTKTFKMYISGNRQQRQWLIIAAKELQLMPTTEGGLDYKLNLTHAIDGYSGLEHALPIYPIFKDVSNLFVEAQITYSPTLLVAYGGPFGENYFYATEDVYSDGKLRHFTPYADIAQKSLRRGRGGAGGGWFHEEEHVFQKHAEFVSDLITAGGRAGVGAHGQLQGLGYHWELWAIQSGGLSEHDALRVATIYGAEGIGFGQDLGSIEGGKLADIVVLNADPLNDIRNTREIQYVMKNGRLYEGDTLDEVWPQQRKLPDFHWRKHQPNTAAGIR